jgi:D-cysteine desulfhydrase family pyridoxal phosphate-dependent enzyme
MRSDGTMTLAVEQRLTNFPRLTLLTAVPPLERWDRISAELGVSLFVKRDDLTGIGAGGNKLRKLEWLLGKARAEGATWLLTTGGPQSNHARLTAAAAAKADMGCTLMLRGPWNGAATGNLLLDRLFGAKVQLLGDVDYSAADQAMEEEAKRLRLKGEHPVIIPLGGATAEGTASYVSAFLEMLRQFAEHVSMPDYLVVATGTGSTYAGLLLGATLFASKTRVIGISVSWSKEKLESEAHRLIAETVDLLGVSPHLKPNYRFETGFIGPGYAKISEEDRAAVQFVARNEGILLDTTYTGKAFAGLISLVKSGNIPKGAKVAFVHTGGTPELYTRSVDDLLGANDGRLPRKLSKAPLN